MSLSSEARPLLLRVQTDILAMLAGDPPGALEPFLATGRCRRRIAQTGVRHAGAALGGEASGRTGPDRSRRAVAAIGDLDAGIPAAANRRPCPARGRHLSGCGKRHAAGRHRVESPAVGRRGRRCHHRGNVAVASRRLQCGAGAGLFTPRSRGRSPCCSPLCAPMATVWGRRVRRHAARSDWRRAAPRTREPAKPLGCEREAARLARTTGAVGQSRQSLLV